MPHVRRSTRENYTQLVSEPCQGDTLAEIYSFPAATGQEIRNMMSRQGISIPDAALVLETSRRYVRSRMRHGTLRGKETWEFLCFLPQRSATIRSLNHSARWQCDQDRQTTKLFSVTNYGERIPCIGIRWNPETLGEAVVMNASKRPPDSTDILFGRLDTTWCSTAGAFQLPVLTRRPLDHVRAYGSNTLQLAHEHCERFWSSLKSGDAIDLTITASVHAHRRICRAELLESDAGTHLPGPGYT